MADRDVQAVVVGAGPAGYAAAIRLGQLGVETVVVERERVGGVCLNHGCIPSKALLHASRLFEQARSSEDLGIVARDIRVDHARTVAWKDDVVRRLTDGVAALIRGNGAELVQGTARLVGREEVEVTTSSGRTERLRARSVVIATGARPVELPGLPFDHPRILTSREVLALREVPGRLVVVGGGYIGMELGTVFARLGSRVTVVEALDRVLASLPEDLVRPVVGAARKRGVDFLTGARVGGCEDRQGGLLVRVETRTGPPRTLEADAVLVAAGLRPNTEGIGLEEAGVTLDRRGFVETGPDLRTRNPAILAIGDVRGGMMLAHKAYAEAEVAALVVAGHRASMEDVRAIPWVVFTDPEVAGAGLSEEEARRQGIPVRVGRFPFAASGRAMTLHEREGFLRVVVREGDGRVLGFEGVGPELAELTGEFALALEMGCTGRDVGHVVHVHPTLSEVIPEACRNAFGEALHVMNRSPSARSGSGGR